MAVKPKAVSKPDKKNHSQQDDLSHLAKAIISSAGVGIYIVQHGKFVYVSELYQKLSGYTDTDIIGTYYLGNIYPDDRKMIREEAIKCLKAERFEPYEYRFIKKNDEVMWVLETITPIIYKEDRATLGSFMDITERKQMEKELRQSEEKYRTVLENIEEGYFEVDLAGNYISLNDSFCRIHGYSRKELMGINNRQHTDQETAKEVFKAFNGVYKTGIPLKEIDWQITRKDGTKRYIEASASLQKDLSGKPIGFRGLIRDITESKRTERILRENEERLRGITQNLPGIIFQFYAKDSGEYGLSYVSERLAEFSKIVANLDMANLDSLFPLFLSHIHEEDRDRLLTSIKTAVATETSWNFEGRVSIQPGMMIWIHGLSTPTRHEDQLVFYGILLNITERKKAEERLKQSEAQYRLLADNIHDVIFVLDMNLNYTYVSPSVKILRGYEPEEALKHTPAETLTPSSMDLAMRTLAEIMEMEKSEHREINISRTLQLEMNQKDGTTVWTEMMASFVRDENQRPVGIMGLTRNITERKKAEEALKNSEAKYRNIFENAVEGIYQSTIEGRIITANAAFARMAGYDSPEELIESIKDIGTQLYVHPEDRKRFLGIREAKGFVEGFEVEFYKKDGSKFWVVINARAVKDEQGKILYLEGLIEDITIRKNAEEQLHKTLESLRKAVGTTIQVLVSALESRDPYTAGHQKRVADLARTIATEMGLPHDIIEGIRMAGSIHDIGKLSIPSEILSKPAKLTNIEFSLIKEHPQSGYEMLKDVESPWPLAQIVYQHHERMNGSGYPRNLKGDEILMEARIMAVADVVEAMASHRPYRPGLGIEVALEEIEKNKGTFYDDTVADACLKLFREKGYQLK